MTVALLQLSFAIPHANSLKDKRRALRSVKHRIAGGWNVSVAETDAQDVWRTGVLSVAMVGSDRAYVEGAMAKVVDFCRGVPQVDLSDFRLDFLA